MADSERVGITGGGGGTQVMLPESFTDAAFVELAVAVLFITVQAATLVAALTTTVAEAPWSMLPKLQDNVCAPTVPLMLQFAEVVV